MRTQKGEDALSLALWCRVTIMALRDRVTDEKRSKGREEHLPEAVEMLNVVNGTKPRVETRWGRQVMRTYYTVSTLTNRFRKNRRLEIAVLINKAISDEASGSELMDSIRFFYELENTALRECRHG